MGTAAHAFTLLFDSEEDAFRAQVVAMGTGTTLLVDTYDIPTAVETAVRVAGPALGAVRIDSGDLAVLTRQVRDQLDALGATSTRITVTNDLDEFAIAGLADAPIDSFGVGTSVVTGSGVPAAGMVYKLVAHHDEDGAWIPVAKRSAQKATVAGRKRGVRYLRDGVAFREGIVVESTPTPGTGARALSVELAIDGTSLPEFIGASGVTSARQWHADAIAELPPDAFDRSPGDPAIPTDYFSFS
jgi:nicotinate phosphoribosyltransferase